MDANLRTFKAETMAEAINQVKGAMGEDAIILHTRTYQLRQWLGLRRRNMVEITATDSETISARRRPRQAVGRRPAVAGDSPALAAPARPHLPASTTRPAYGPGSGTNLPATRPPQQPLVINPAVTSRAILDMPANNSMVAGLSEEMRELKAVIAGFVKEQRQTKVPQVPEELYEHYKQLIENKVAEELAQEIVCTLRREIRPEYLSQRQYVNDRMVELIEKLIPTAGPIMRTKTVGPHIVALVGPTGVGKTTTLAKLAAILKIRENKRVGLITLDMFRMAAFDQLKRYGTILDTPVKVVADADQLRDAIATMSDMHYILIDTAGRSPRDTLQLKELRELLNSIKPDEVHLVVSSNAEQDAVEMAIERFTEVGAKNIIFTKLDEAAHLGVVLNVARKLNTALSYITMGQDVGTDIEVGHGKRLAQMIVANDGVTRCNA